MPRILVYKVTLLVALAALAASTSGLFYYYQNRTASLTSQVATLNSQNDATSNSLNSLKDQIANLTLQINILNKQTLLLLGNNTQLQADLAQLQSQTAQLQNQIVTLQTKNDQLKNQIVQLESQVNQLQATNLQVVIQLQNQITNLDAQNAQLQTQVLQLQAQVTMLEAELASNLGLCGSGKTLQLGELTDLTSALSFIGNEVSKSTQLAVSDVNSFLYSTGCNLKFSLKIDDYQLDNALALSDLQALGGQGVQAVIGPLNSGAAQYILSFADSHHIVLISPSSSNPLLSIDNDYLFRTVPNDAAQANADVRMMIDRGAKALIIVQRHDAYGDGVASTTASRFTQLGGTVVDRIMYDTFTTDFASILTTLNNDYTSANTGANIGKVALDFVSFEEFGTIIIQANQQHPSLLSNPLPWFGTDGEADDAILTANATIGPLIAKVRLPSTLFAFQNNTKTLAFLTKFSSNYPGQLCDTYCLSGYDDVWLAALSTLQVGAYDGTKVQSAILTVASNYYGVTGWNGLDQSGDRIPQSYQIWKAVSLGTGFTWVIAGNWDEATDSVTWTSPP